MLLFMPLISFLQPSYSHFYTLISCIYYRLTLLINLIFILIIQIHTHPNILLIPIIQYQKFKKKMQSTYKTILTDSPHSASASSQQNATHPLFYFQHRNQFLTTLSDKYSSKYQLPTMDLKRNVRANYYLHKYQNIKSDMQKQKIKKNCFLNSQQFGSVFTDCMLERRERNREKREEEQLRRDLNRFLRYQEEVHEEPEHDEQNGQDQQQYNTVLVDYREDAVKKKQMYLLDLQIGKIMLQQQIQKRVQQKHQSCQNEQLLSKLSNNILSAYMLNFDEIYNNLIDEILTQQVYYLNYMEAQYQVQKSEWATTSKDKPYQQYDNAKAIQMMQLVKGLQDLCDN